MPTQTFFNLSDEKRERILDAAVDEFAQQSFNNASIAKIVENAGISRGSFYQYFADLIDLYKYIFQMIGERKKVYLQEVIGQMGQMDFFPLMRELYAGGIRFAVEQPKLAQIGNNFFKEDTGFKRQVMEEFGQQSQDFFIGLLKMGQAKGEIGLEVDLKVASFMFYNLNITLVDYFLEQKEQENFFDDLDGFFELVDQMLSILKNGMGPR